MTTPETQKDFSPQQRHDIIMETLQSLNKSDDCFHYAWDSNNDELLTSEILIQTPMFWFMKYKWSRQEIETLFFKAHIVITSGFDNALTQTFGGQPGARWKGGGGVRNKKKQQQQYTQRDWSDPEKNKNANDDGDGNYGTNDYKFQYTPVQQDVHFEADGGVDQKTKEQDPAKIYGTPDWQRLQKTPTDSNKGSGPIMGKGKQAADADGAPNKNPNPKKGLNVFLTDIITEIENDDDVKEPTPDDDANLHDDDDDDDDDGVEDEAEQFQLDSFLSNFSEADLNSIESAVDESTNANDASAFRKKKSRSNSRALSVKTTITTCKIMEPSSPSKLKRMAGGKNIASKGVEKMIRTRSNTLRREKAEIDAVLHAKANTPLDSVTTYTW